MRECDPKDKVLDLTVVRDSEVEDAYRKAAKEKHANEQGNIEVDSDAAVSLSSSGGAYVQARTWIDANDADRCRAAECHGDLTDGEGYDGLCGNCADRKESNP